MYRESLNIDVINLEKWECLFEQLDQANYLWYT
jgi:hypothetical protein